LQQHLVLSIATTKADEFAMKADDCSSAAIMEKFCEFYIELNNSISPAFFFYLILRTRQAVSGIPC